MKKAGDLVFSIHIHDNDGNSDLHWPIGQGTVDWTNFFKELKKINQEVGLVHEVEGYAKPGFVARKCIENVKSFL